MPKPHPRIILALLAAFVLALACGRTAPAAGPGPEIVLQRLHVAYLGLDGNRLVGSGCPGDFGRGQIEDYHFVVTGLDPNREVVRVVVAGDNSTLTWEWPCRDDWELLAQPVKPGMWELFIAPSLPAKIYTVIFFYDDDRMALGMAEAP